MDLPAGNPETPGALRERQQTSWVLLGCLGLGVLAVLAIVIPGLQASGRASGERTWSSSLKTLASAEAEFRGNDRDLNQKNDFWFWDVAGLYALKGDGGKPIKFIDLSVGRGRRPGRRSVGLLEAVAQGGISLCRHPAPGRRNAL
jgi:hypothetical protein